MTFLEKDKDHLSEKEAAVYEEICDFKEADQGVVQWAADALDTRLESLADSLEDTRPGELLDTVAGVILELINDVSIWSVREKKIWENFEDAELEVTALEDLRDFSLEEIEEALGRLRLKYRLAASLQGMSVGSFGLAGALTGLPTLIAMSLRAIAEYATYYGFDVTSEPERPYVLMVLAVAASSGETRTELLDQVEEYALSAEKKGSSQAPMPSTSEVVDHLAVRLVRGKVSQTVPLAGALLGAGFNQAFVQHVCETAHQLLRQRWLIRRYQ